MEKIMHGRSSALCLSRYSFHGGDDDASAATVRDAATSLGAERRRDEWIGFANLFRVNTRQEAAGQEAVSTLEEKERNRTRVAHHA